MIKNNSQTLEVKNKGKNPRKGGFFDKQKQQYLYRIKEEIQRLKCSVLFGDYSSTEISLILISVLLRKLIEIDLIKISKSDYDNLNLIIHMHAFFVNKDGDIFVTSDKGLKNNKKLKIDKNFIDKIESKINKCF